MRKTFVALILALFLFTVPIMATVDVTSSQINSEQKPSFTKPIAVVNSTARPKSILLNYKAVSIQNATVQYDAELVGNMTIVDNGNVVQNLNSTNNLSMATVTTNTSDATFGNNLIRQLITSRTAQNIVLSSSLYNYNSAAKNLNMIAYNTGQLWMAPDIVSNSQYFFSEKSDVYDGVSLSSLINNSIC